MWDNLPIFKSVEVINNKGSTTFYTNSSILITGNYLIIIKKDLTEIGYLNHMEHNVINLSEIKSYRIK